MTDCTLETSTVDWILDHPETAPVLDELGVDVSCAGKSLAYHCRRLGLDPLQVLRRLHRAIESSRGASNADANDLPCPPDGPAGPGASPMPERTPRVAIARAYDLPPPRGEYRALVDRLWPRGVSRSSLALDAWLKHLAPSPELRRWFGHRPERWDEFRTRYLRELDDRADALADLARLAADRPLLLIYAARDAAHNDAVVLRDRLLQTPPLAD